MQITLTPAVAGVSPEGGTLDVLVRVVAPPGTDRDARPRPPLHLALVLDRSGSMEGAPLEAAKRCADSVARRLRPDDRAALVVYDNRVRVPIPLRPADAPGIFADALASVRSGGSTDLHAGWDAGAGQLAPAATPASLSRVVLLSDGCANQGLTDTDAIAARCRALADAGVGTTTIGLGRHFNEELMTAMARAGGGRSYYGERAEDLADAFAEEMALLEDLCARRLRARLAPGPGVVVAAVSETDADPGLPVPLADLPYGAASWLLVTLHVAPRPDAVRTLLSVEIQGEADGAPFVLGPSLLELPTLSPEALAAQPRDPEVAARAADVAVSRILEAARRAIRRHDREAAGDLLEQARALGADSPWLAASVAELERLRNEDDEIFAKEARFMAAKMATRNLAADAGNRVEEAPLYLREKRRQGRGEDDAE